MFILTITSFIFFFWFFFATDILTQIPPFQGRITGREPAFCYDTDEGIDYYERGVVYGRKATGETFRYFDYCEGDVLKEWHCVNLQSALEDHECPRGCMSGGCKI